MLVQQPSNNNVLSRTQIIDKIVLIGPLVGQKKHGEYIYIIDGSLKQYAGQYEQDNKVGLWWEISEISKKYMEHGEYEEGRRKGQWLIIKQEQTMQIIYEISGGGVYDEKGKKTGLWFDIDIWNDRCFVICKGEYKNGLQIGRWVTWCCKNNNEFDNFFEMGGGFFNDHGLKEGRWFEFDRTKQIKWTGVYKNGLRIGLWKQLYRPFVFEYYNLIAGGQYDEFEMKQGPWVEIIFQVNEQYYYPSFDIVERGNYKNNKRVGEWITLEATYKKICGKGTYDENGLKVGEWTEYNQLEPSIYLTECGKYENGKRIGFWKLYFHDGAGKSLEGKGNYNFMGEKQGFWTEIVSNRKKGIVNFSGEYKFGKRCGKWQYQIYAFDNEKVKNQYYLVFQGAGGYYDDKGIKQGLWDDFFEAGEYKNGIKIGNWHSARDVTNGLYNKNGEKDEILYLYKTYDQEGFISSSQWFGGENLRFYENYKNGFHVNTIGIIYGTEHKEKTICSSDERGFKTGYWFYGKHRCGSFKNGYKIGKWSEHDCIINYNDYGFKCGYQKESIQNNFSFQGVWENGQRIGKWSYAFQGKEIGGGHYNDVGLKHGFWIEPFMDYREGSESTYQGEYNNQIRIGEWKIFYLNGGGFYDEYGLKQGLWVESPYEFNFQKQFTEEGNYKDSIKVGRWKQLFKRKEVGGGIYNENGEKEGRWKICLISKMKTFKTLQHDFQEYKTNR